MSGGVSYTSDDIEIVPALNRAAVALRVHAIDHPSNLERLRLQALADVLDAERRTLAPR